MAKNRSRRKKGGRGGNPPGVNREQRVPGSSSVTLETPQPEQSIRAEHEQALATAEKEGLEVPPVGGEPRPEDVDNEALWKMVRETRDNYDEARKRYESRNQELDARTAKLGEQELSITERDKELDTRESELAEERTALAQRDDEASERERTLLDRETDIRQREINAERGFIKERQEMLSQLDEARDAFRAEYAEKWQAGEARLQEREGALDEREDQLAGERRELATFKRRLEYEKEDLEELRADLDSRAKRQAAAIHEKLEHDKQLLTAELEQARADRDRHAETLRQREDADRKFGQRTPDDMLRELDTLRTKIGNLQADLAERPDADAVARLEELERERETWQAERIELNRQVSEYRQRYTRVHIDATERESQRDVIASLTSRRELLHKAHEELRTEVEDLHRRSEAQTPFPACTGMDEDPDFQSIQPKVESLELENFVKDLQHRIVATSSAEPLYYSLPDLRSFIGGLAMGRLILLQGISGTGKTSLPVAFARAVGTQAAEIKVQAGWRDPQDLIGHYNTFEKRFHETEFLKALYQAGTPRWKDTIQVILLDEMNLSHPEQYFSDLLSTLELPMEDQRLEIVTHAAKAAPALLDKNGKLPIPPNIWFVGTANHDETTMDFADKTYDRSHVMEFPVRPKPFNGRNPSPRHPIAFSALQRAFTKARQEHHASAQEAVNYLDTKVRDRLAADFQVGWGPRLHRQMDQYVPVVVAAGGTVGEATDHMLAMRLLRKLANRHDNRPERVEALKQRILESWSTLDEKSEPAKSRKLLDSELRRLGREPENDG